MSRNQSWLIYNRTYISMILLIYFTHRSDSILSFFFSFGITKYLIHVAKFSTNKTEIVKSTIVKSSISLQLVWNFNFVNEERHVDHSVKSNAIFSCVNIPHGWILPASLMFFSHDSVKLCNNSRVDDCRKPVHSSGPLECYCPLTRWRVASLSYHASR